MSYWSFNRAAKKLSKKRVRKSAWKMCLDIIKSWLKWFQSVFAIHQEWVSLVSCENQGVYTSTAYLRISLPLMVRTLHQRLVRMWWKSLLLWSASQVVFVFVRSSFHWIVCWHWFIPSVIHPLRQERVAPRGPAPSSAARPGPTKRSAEEILQLAERAHEVWLNKTGFALGLDSQDGFWT